MTDNLTKILLIDDDQITQDILQQIFEHYQIKQALSGEQGLQIAPEFLPDLIVLDINMPGIDGYETCKKFRENDLFSTTPILFLSQYHKIEDRLKAYGVGGNDYISKPVDNNELLAKSKQLIESKKQQDELHTELKSSYDTVLGIQAYAANLQVIGRFLMANLFCKDLQDLADLFMKTAKELNISCILSLDSNQHAIICSDTGSINRLEEEIIGMSDQLERIHPFGKNRSLFNWKNMTVLVRNIDDNADIMAILLDGMETGIRAIDKEQLLLSTVSELEAKSIQIETKIENEFNEMKSALSEIFFSLGMTKLDPEEEERLNQCVDNYSDNISQELTLLQTNNKNLSHIINELRTPAQDNKTDQESNPDTDSIDFF